MQVVLKEGELSFPFTVATEEAFMLAVYTTQIASADYSAPLKCLVKALILYSEVSFLSASPCLVFHACVAWSLHTFKWTHDSFVKACFPELLLHFHLQVAD